MRNPVRTGASETQGDGTGRDGGGGIQSGSHKVSNLSSLLPSRQVSCDLHRRWPASFTSDKVGRTRWKYEADSAASVFECAHYASVWIRASAKWLNSKLCAEDSRLAGQIKELCLSYISAGSNAAQTANRFCYCAGLMVDDWGEERESPGEDMWFSTCPSSFL